MESLRRGGRTGRRLAVASDSVGDSLVDGVHELMLGERFLLHGGLMVDGWLMVDDWLMIDGWLMVDGSSSPPTVITS